VCMYVCVCIMYVCMYAYIINVMYVCVVYRKKGNN
jgi:hypothetical protein